MSGVVVGVASGQRKRRVYIYVYRVRFIKIQIQSIFGIFKKTILEKKKKG